MCFNGCRTVFGNKSFAIRLTFPLLAFLALAAAFSAVRTSRPIRFIEPAGFSPLERGAQEYLSQAARVLGDRFNEKFCRDVVQTQRNRRPLDILNCEKVSRECFSFLASEIDDGAAEALAFLDEIEGSPVSIPDEIPYLAGNPVNALADWLARLSPVLPDSPAARLYVAAAPLSSEELALFFSLIPFMASLLFPSSPLGAAAGVAAAVILEFFRRLLRPFFLFRFFPDSETQINAGITFPLLTHTSLEEKKVTVLLR